MLLESFVIFAREFSFEVLRNQLDHFLAGHRAQRFHGHLRVLPILVQGMADFRPCSVEQYAMIRIRKSKQVAYFPRGATLNIPEGDHEPLYFR